jgi:hypothetical protein
MRGHECIEHVLGHTSPTKRRVSHFVIWPSHFPAFSSQPFIRETDGIWPIIEAIASQTFQDFRTSSPGFDGRLPCRSG